MAMYIFQQIIVNPVKERMKENLISFKTQEVIFTLTN